MTADRRKPLGAAGEAAAATHLRTEGYTILAANWRCRIGELDIVAEKDGELVFVEVRTRSAKSLSSFGMPLESITPKKQQTLRRCAEAYIQRMSAAPGRIRFDCIGVVTDAEDAPVRIEHLKHAF